MILKELIYTIRITSHMTGKEAEHTFKVDASNVDIRLWLEATKTVLRKLVGLNAEEVN